MPQTIVGAVSNVQADVDTNRALKTTLRPPDVGVLGSYRLSSVGGTYASPMAAGLAAASPIWSCRFAPTVNPTSLALVRKVLFQATSAGTAFAAGGIILNLFPIRGYTVNDTGGAALTINTAVTTGKLRTSNAITGMNDFRTSATATLTAGTQTVDTNPIGTINTTVAAAADRGTASTTANLQLIPINTPLFEAKVGEPPFVLAINEGLVIRATVPATGTWLFGVTMEWDEVASY